MLVYKIFREEEWRDMQAEGRTDGAPVDLADGFIHLSTAAQAPETAARHFAGQDGLWLIVLDSDQLGEDLRWEPSRNNEDFPHLYRPLDMTDVVWTRPLPLVDGVHDFGDLA